MIGKVHDSKLKRITGQGTLEMTTLYTLQD